ncbi:MAG TPA: TRAP transporter substrate-binding protein [Xanthobacteraceae bacterium]|jgi:TRAP-type C4-dicarboxylate transport system substrate-binding protein|nr:TRAP transporter substrate-binding protein [Xanthobacteraceae bacterium]
MRHRVLLALIPFVLGVPLAFAVVPKALSAAQYVLKWAVVTRGDMQEKFGHKLAEVLPQATNGRVEVQVFPGGQLGSPSAMIEGLQLGTIEAYENPADFFTGVDPRFGIFSIPFLFKSTEQANKVLADPDYNAYVLNMAQSKGLVGVNLAVAAESLYFGVKKPLRTLADFKGMKLRVNATPAERARMAALGATAVPMGLPEMITSLQNGVIDGTMSGMSIFTNFNLQNVGKVLLETHDTLLISFGAMSKPWLDKLPPDLSKIIVDQARKLQPWARQTAVDEVAQLRQVWLSRGGEIVHLAPAEQAELEKRLKPIGAEVTKDDPVLKAFYDKTEALAAKYQ